MVLPKFPLQYLSSNPTPIPQNFWIPLLGLFCTTSEKGIQKFGGVGVGLEDNIQEGEFWDKKTLELFVRELPHLSGPEEHTFRVLAPYSFGGMRGAGGSDNECENRVASLPTFLFYQLLS